MGQPALKRVGRYNTGISYGLSIKDHYAYVTTNTSLIILDIIKPEKPVKLSELKIGTPIFDVQVMNDYAFLAASSEGLIIANISNSNNPKIVSRYSVNGKIAKIEADKNLCYTLTYENGFEIIDVGNPLEPKSIGNFQIKNARNLKVQNNIAYISDPKNGLTILDISDPTEIKKIRVVDNTKGAAGIGINNGLLYLGSYGNLVRIFNVSDPQSPIFITQYQYSNEVSGLIVFENYLITKFQGIKIEDISDIYNPRVYAQYHIRGIKGGVHDIIVQDNYVFFVLKGITILKIIEDLKPEILRK